MLLGAAAAVTSAACCSQINQADHCWAVVHAGDLQCHRISNASDASPLTRPMPNASKLAKMAPKPSFGELKP
jgi:hypothetical protein